MNLKRPLSLLLLLLLSPYLVISQTTARREAPRLVLIRAGKLLDVRSGRILLNQAILIEGDRIKEVGAAQALMSRAPAGTETIDLSNMTVLPGLWEFRASAGEVAKLERGRLARTAQR